MFNFFKHNERGQSTIEFALILPVLFILVCSVIELGHLANCKLQLDKAAYDAVHFVQTTDKAEAKDVVEYFNKSYEYRSYFSFTTDENAEDVVSVSVVTYPAQQTKYQHHIYNETDKTFEERASVCGVSDVRVRMDLNKGYATPFGALISAFVPEWTTDGFVLHSEFNGSINTTDGGSW